MGDGGSPAKKQKLPISLAMQCNVHLPNNWQSVVTPSSAAAVATSGYSHRPQQQQPCPAPGVPSTFSIKCSGNIRKLRNVTEAGKKDSPASEKKASVPRAAGGPSHPSPNPVVTGGGTSKKPITIVSNKAQMGAAAAAAAAVAAYGPTNRSHAATASKESHSATGRGAKAEHMQQGWYTWYKLHTCAISSGLLVIQG